MLIYSKGLFFRKLIFKFINLKNYHYPLLEFLNFNFNFINIKNRIMKDIIEYNFPKNKHTRYPEKITHTFNVIININVLPAPKDL